MEQRIILNLPPVTKKNHGQIVMIKLKNGGKMPKFLPSKQYTAYEKACGEYLKHVDPFLSPCNMKCLYYMPTRRKVDLVNLLQATSDILVHYGILMDDNSTIIRSYDGSRVLYNKENPRTEIVLTEVEDA